MCKMHESKYGVYSRGKSSYVEVEAFRNDTYEVFVSKAARKCKLRHEKHKLLSLFKLNGARILNEDLNVNGKIKSWTLGNYLTLLKKSPSNVKLGVGQVLADISLRDSSDSDKCDSDEASEKSSEDDHGMMAVSIITVELF